MQYTGYDEVSENDPPTYACVGRNDGIANWQTMQQRLENLNSLGIYPNLGHDFGLGTNTPAQGWIDDAVTFWQKQME